MRSVLELGLPMVGVFLVVPLLSTEWEQGTLVQLALRKPIVIVLLLRLLFALGYLTIVTVAATLISLRATSPWLMPDGNGVVQWIAIVLLTAMAPTLLLAMLSLLVTHGLVSAASGYLFAVGYWFVNLITESIVLMSRLRPFLLFGWTFSVGSGPYDWLLGKVVLCIVAGMLLALQVPLLRNEMRLVRNKWE